MPTNITTQSVVEVCGYSIQTPYWATKETEVLVIEKLDGTAKIRFHSL